MSRRTPLLPDADDVAACRVRFLTADPVAPGHVRGPILASWHRSQDEHVLADQVEPPFLEHLDRDTPLTRSAEPVLIDLHRRLGGQSVSIILTDPSGLVLRRLTGDRGLERDLDRVQLAPGFSYAEKEVGTNGIGTALEVGGPAHVFGHEHYAENLEDFGCAGVPIKHPLSGRTVGALDLTCWRKDAGPLLLTLAKTTAGQIRQAMMTDAAGHEMLLFQEYLRSCRRMTGAVFALNGDVVMMNDYARTALDPVDQAALLNQAGEALAAGRRGSLLATLPTGLEARLQFRPVPGGGDAAGIVHVRLGRAAATPKERTRQAAGRMPLPGLAGSAPLWLRASDEVERLVQAREWLAVEGEPGVGKMAVLRAVHLRHQLVGRLVVLDTADAGGQREWLATVRAVLSEDGRHVVLRDVDRLDGRRLRSLARMLTEIRDAGAPGSPWVAVTLGTAPRHPDLDELLNVFPSSVELPPLRLHPEDVPDLVASLLARLDPSGRLDCSPDALQLLVRSSWPGNAEQLHQTLREVLHHRRTGSIRPEDLPPEARVVSRRRLSPLESLERDAILKSLLDARGNKMTAARTLGMSRATIYRKLHAYGIVVPTG